MSFRTRYAQARLFRHDWAWLLVSVVFFGLFPAMDLQVSAWFWTPEERFRFNTSGWVQFFYVVFANIHFIYLAGLLFFLVRRFFPNDQTLKFKKNIIFLLLALILGPGLVVNGVLKEHVGRARPQQVEAFGGTQKYTPAFVISKQCETNCSFVSGHAAGAFFILSMSWVLQQQRWLWLGLLLGGMTGAGRMLQGGHFFSDIVFAFWSVYFSSLLLAIWLGLKSPRQAGPPVADKPPLAR